MPSGELAVQQETIQQQVHELYSHHHRWLYSWLSNKLGCSHQAADLSHDTFVRLLKKQQALNLREPRAYLSTIAHSLVVNLWRRRDVEQAYLSALEALPAPVVSSVEVHAIVIETLMQIDAALKGLPSRVRQAFLLSQLDGLTYKDIAQRLDVSERMVKKYMARAMLHCLSATECDA